MKLPEHYEQWLDVLEKSESDGLLDPYFKHGARSMYIKLMEDLAPAIEALKEMEGTLSLMKDNAPSLVFHGVISGFFDSCGTHEGAKQALAGLKEKGLVE